MCMNAIKKIVRLATKSLEIYSSTKHNTLNFFPKPFFLQAPFINKWNGDWLRIKMILSPTTKYNSYIFYFS